VTRTAVINIVGLTRALIGEHTPALRRFMEYAGLATVDPSFPAVTCTAQTNYITGTTPARHGIVANGWYNRELAEVQFWKQSNHLVQQPRLWDELRARDPRFTCAKLFWWYNMYSTADWSITPRPMYPADGRKVFDIYTFPFSIRTGIKKDLGEFPFPCFWGPAAGRKSPQGGPAAVSEWIASSARWIETRHSPTLSLIYLPHLDYNLQRLGPRDPRIADDLRAIDEIAGNLIDFFRTRGVRVVVLSEYGITEVKRPVHINRLLRERGWLVVKEELGREILDAGASRAFAVADHQVAHLYLNDPSIAAEVRKVVAATPGVAQVMGEMEKPAAGINHPRTGDLVAVAEEDAWFTYYHWLDDARAPDFARTVDIHRKPGYDPVELFLDPALKFPKMQIAWRLLKKKLGFRMLMDVIPLDASLVKGSHGCRPRNPDDWPVLMGDNLKLPPTLRATDVYGVLRDAVIAEN
jgi:predicted AlkP superfamily pyrophosphatase or phosphodiesterase